MKKYFAYGSNMDSARIKERLGRVPSAMRASLPSYRLCFNKVAKGKPGTGWANVATGSDSDAVHGILYEVCDDEMSTLDRIEIGYCRQAIRVCLANGTLVQAFTYVACPECVEDGRLPTRKYLNCLLAGRNCLPAEYVATLKRHEVRG